MEIFDRICDTALEFSYGMLGIKDLAWVVAGAASQPIDCATSLVDVVKEKGQTLTPEVVNIGNFTELLDDDEAELTLFAPTDSAFFAALTLFPDIDIAALLTNTAFLKELVGYHIVPGKFLSTDLEDGMILETQIARRSSCGNDTLLVKVRSLQWWPNGGRRVP